MAGIDSTQSIALLLPAGDLEKTVHLSSGTDLGYDNIVT